jgi:hypothetical protein
MTSLLRETLLWAFADKIFSILIFKKSWYNFKKIMLYAEFHNSSKAVDRHVFIETN